MTSTYLAPFRGFLAPGFRGPAELSRSSMLLELLRVVAGRLPAAAADCGGALALLALDADRSMATGPGGGALARPASAAPAAGGRGGPAAADGGAGAGLELAERGVALGGGGVAFLAVSSALAFLLTHRLSSGS